MKNHPLAKRPFTALRPKFTLYSLFIVLFGLLTLFGVTPAQPALAAVNCADNNWSVDNAADLSSAIGCFNGKSAAGTYTITLTDDITLTVALASIINSTANVELLIDGDGFTVDADGNNFRVFYVRPSTVVTLQDITLTGGSPSGSPGVARGAGIYSNQGVVTITNSTISGNDTDNFGGAIHSRLGTLSVINSTISDNIAASGGGIYNDRSTLTLSNTIIANSTGGDCVNSSGTVNFSSFNLIEDAANACGLTNGAASNIVGFDPALGPLQDNGGSLTHALLDGSLAIDAGDSALAADQRGVSRPQGSADDIGAYEAAQFTLDVAIAGGGSGTVTSNPAGVNCTSTCSASFLEGTVVTLTAAADGGSTFDGWTGGGCSGTGSCVVTMNSNQSVGATFSADNFTLTVNTDGTGSGSVTKSPDASSYPSGTNVTLTATADAGSTFTGWSGGGCSGTGTCVVAMNSDQTVTATFTLNSYTLTVNTDGTGSGTVTKSPDAAMYDFGTVVTLTATADAGSEFAGWSGGGCSGTGTCVVTMNADITVTATFNEETGGGGGGSTPTTIYLPLIMQADEPAPEPLADLVVDSVTVTGDADVSIVIRNDGTAAADNFWVDLYLGLSDSANVPSQVNDIWEDFSPNGAAWLVTGTINAGDTLTLTVNGTYFVAANSDVGDVIAADTPIYVQVDSAAVGDANGGVLETHEDSGAASNNMFGPVTR